MKDFFKGLLVIGFILMMLVVAGYIETHYERKGIVTEYNKATNEITIVDTTGNVWIYETDKFSVNDKVKMSMHNNYTDSDITDDEILSLKRLDK